MRINDLTTAYPAAGLATEIPKAALVGFGRQGQEHAAAILDVASRGAIDLVAVSDPNPKAASSVELLGARHYNNYEQMLLQENIDLVVVAVPNSMHVAVVEHALSRRLHVLKEKPFASTLEEATRLTHLSLANHCHLKVAQQRFFHPHYQQAAAWLSRIGKIRLLDYTFCLNDKGNSWYWIKSEGGGSWNGLGWHASWAISFFLGLPETVKLTYLSGKRRHSQYDTDDTSILHCGFKNGATARVFVSVVHPSKREELFIEGENGSIRIDRDSLCLYDEHGAELVRDQTAHVWKTAYSRQIESFIFEMRSGIASIDHLAWQTMLLHDAAIRSA